MVLSFSIYTLFSSIILSIDSNIKIATFLKSVIYVFILLLPIVFLNTVKILLVSPVFIILLYRLITKHKNDFLADFLIYSCSLAMLLSNNYFWIFVSYVFFLISTGEINLHQTLKNNLVIQINNVFNILLLIISFFIYKMALTIENKELFIALNSTSLLFLLIFVFRNVGVFLSQKVSNICSETDVIDLKLFDIVFSYFIPINFLFLAKEQFEKIPYLSEKIILIFGVFLILSLLANKFTKRIETISYFAKQIYALNFFILAVWFIEDSNVEINQFLCWAIINLLLLIYIKGLDRKINNNKKFLLILGLIFLMPNFLSPMFYQFNHVSNVLFNQNKNIISVFIIFSVFTPYLFLDVASMLISKFPKGDKIKSIDFLDETFWLMAIITYFLMAYYG